MFSLVSRNFLAMRNIALYSVSMANTCNFYTFYVCPNSRCIYLQCICEFDNIWLALHFLLSRRKWGNKCQICLILLIVHNQNFSADLKNLLTMYIQIFFHQGLKPWDLFSGFHVLTFVVGNNRSNSTSLLVTPNSNHGKFY